MTQADWLTIRTVQAGSVGGCEHGCQHWVATDGEIAAHVELRSSGRIYGVAVYLKGEASLTSLRGNSVLY